MYNTTFIYKKQIRLIFDSIFIHKVQNAYGRRGSVEMEPFED